MELPALTHPERLWWLLLLPLLWLLALPPRPRRALLTAHLPQWLAALAAQQRRPPRLRRWRLLLLVLAATLGVLAHAGLRARAAPGKTRLVVVFDTSASMAARAGGDSAHARAVQLLREQLAALPGNVEVRLLADGDVVTTLQDEVARALATAPAPHGAPSVPLEAAVAAAAADDTATWLLTDGQHGVPAAQRVTVLGRAADNWAITAVDCDDHWPQPALQLAVTVRSFAAVPAHGHLQVSGPVQPFGGVDLDLLAGASHTFALQLQRDGTAGTLQVQLQMPGDALAADDVFTVALPPLPQPDIAVLADADADAVPAVHVAASALAAELGGKVIEAKAGATASFQLIEGGVVTLPQPFRGITFGTRAPSAPTSLWPAPLVTDWDRQQPLLRGLDFSELAVQAAWHGILPEGRPLLYGVGPDGATEPLLVQSPDARGGALHFAFRLQDSNLALLPAFPQLLRRALLPAYGKVALQPAPLVPVGESDLRALPPPQDGALPAFAADGNSLAPWCLLLGLACLALRAWLR